MTKRRQGRVCAVQILFQMDFNPQKPEEAFETFWKENKLDDKSKAFAEDLVRGVVTHQKQIDGLIEQRAENWNLKRMGGVERNAMRMALYEMLYCMDIPPVVTINEAVDIVKTFSGLESRRLVNGILDQVRKELDRPARTAENPTSQKAQT